MWASDQRPANANYPGSSIANLVPQRLANCPWNVNKNHHFMSVIEYLKVHHRQCVRRPPTTPRASHFSRWVWWLHLTSHLASESMGAQLGAQSTYCGPDTMLRLDVQQRTNPASWSSQSREEGSYARVLARTALH